VAVGGCRPWRPNDEDGPIGGRADAAIGSFVRLRRTWWSRAPRLDPGLISIQSPCSSGATPATSRLPASPSEWVRSEPGGLARLDDPPLTRPGSDESEERPIDRIGSRAQETDRPQPEAEDPVLIVAGVVPRRPVGKQEREVRQPTVRGRRPRILPPPRADLRVRPAVESSRRRVCRPVRAMVAELAVVAERQMWLKAKRPAGSANGCVSARLTVLSFDGRRRWTRAAIVVTRPSSSRTGSSRKARAPRCVASVPRP
jgi:hypothetical protein